ncbi:MAG: AI-2E family transporter [bacterium]
MERERRGAVRFAQYLAVLAGAAAAAWFLNRVGYVLSIFAVSAAIAYIINPAVDFLAARRVPRPLAVLGVFVLFVLILGGIALAVLPRVVAQFNELIGNLPDYFAGLERLWTRAVELARKTELPEGARAIPGKMAEHLQGAGTEIGGRVYNATINFLSKLPGLVIIPILVYYFLNDGARMRRGFITSLPPGARGEADALIDRLNRALGGYIRGQVKLCLLMGVLTWLALAAAGVKYSLIFGFIAGVTEFIPYIGPVLGIIGPLIFAFFVSWTMVVKVLIVFLVLQLVENNLLAPRVMSGDVGMHPALIMFVLMAGGQVGGIGGMIAALPAAVTLKALFEHFYIEKYVTVKEAPPAGATEVTEAMDGNHSTAG